MKHVFVETNFLVELLRPFRAPSAQRLFARNGIDVELHLPWVSIVECKRTLTRIVSEDLGFTQSMLMFAADALKSARISSVEMQAIQKLASSAKQDRTAALAGIETTVDTACQSMNIIEPSKAVITKTLILFPIKSLPPFDEMVLGAILVRAEELRSKGLSGFSLCNLNKNDFDPSRRPELAKEYARLSINYFASFEIP